MKVTWLRQFTALNSSASRHKTCKHKFCPPKSHCSSGASSITALTNADKCTKGRNVSCHCCRLGFQLVHIRTSCHQESLQSSYLRVHNHKASCCKAGRAGRGADSQGEPGWLNTVRAGAGVLTGGASKPELLSLEYAEGDLKWWDHQVTVRKYKKVVLNYKATEGFIKSQAGCLVSEEEARQGGCIKEAEEGVRFRSYSQSAS